MEAIIAIVIGLVVVNNPGILSTQPEDSKQEENKVEVVVEKTPEPEPIVVEPKPEEPVQEEAKPEEPVQEELKPEEPVQEEAKPEDPIIETTEEKTQELETSQKTESGITSNILYIIGIILAIVGGSFFLIKKIFKDRRGSITPQNIISETARREARERFASKQPEPDLQENKNETKSDELIQGNEVKEEPNQVEEKTDESPQEETPTETTEEEPQPGNNDQSSNNEDENNNK